MDGGGGAALSSALLIADLGRPSRFLNMLRVFKPQSTMSMGSWALSAFSAFAGISTFADLLALALETACQFAVSAESVASARCSSECLFTTTPAY